MVTAATFLPPVTAATIVNAMLLALLWYGQPINRRGGPLSKANGFGVIVYTAAISAFLVMRGHEPLTGRIDLFGVALAGETMGLGIVGSTLHAALASRGMSLWQRVPSQR